MRARILDSRRCAVCTLTFGCLHSHGLAPSSQLPSHLHPHPYPGILSHGPYFLLHTEKHESPDANLLDSPPGAKAPFCRTLLTPRDGSHPLPPMPTGRPPSSRRSSWYRGSFSAGPGSFGCFLSAGSLPSALKCSCLSYTLGRNGMLPTPPCPYSFSSSSHGP